MCIDYGLIWVVPCRSAGLIIINTSIGSVRYLDEELEHELRLARAGHARDLLFGSVC